MNRIPPGDVDPPFPLGGAPLDPPTLSVALHHLRALVASGPAVLKEDGPFDPVAVCFHCGAKLNRVAHTDTCAWWLARSFLLEKNATEEPGVPDE